MALGIKIEINAEEVLDELTLDQIVDYIGSDNLLETIGKEEAIGHFDLELAD